MEAITNNLGWLVPALLFILLAFYLQLTAPKPEAEEPEQQDTKQYRIVNGYIEF